MQILKVFGLTDSESKHRCEYFKHHLPRPF